jgi:hypothetical protein
MSPIQYSYYPANYTTNSYSPNSYTSTQWEPPAYSTSSPIAASALWKTDSYGSNATPKASQKPSVLSSLWQSAAAYIAGRKILQSTGHLQPGGAGIMTHLSSIGALTVGLHTLKNQLTPNTDGSEKQTPGWLTGLLAFGGTLAGLLFLCKRFDMNALLNQASESKTLRELPAFGRLQQALGLLHKPEVQQSQPEHLSRVA